VYILKWSILLTKWCVVPSRGRSNIAIDKSFFPETKFHLYLPSNGKNNVTNTSTFNNTIRKQRYSLGQFKLSLQFIPYTHFCWSLRITLLPNNDTISVPYFSHPQRFTTYYYLISQQLIFVIIPLIVTNDNYNIQILCELPSTNTQKAIKSKIHSVHFISYNRIYTFNCHLL
jgi:hypothetical protein